MRWESGRISVVKFIPSQRSSFVKDVSIDVRCSSWSVCWIGFIEDSWHALVKLQRTIRIEKMIARNAERLVSQRLNDRGWNQSIQRMILPSSPFRSTRDKDSWKDSLNAFGIERGLISLSQIVDIRSSLRILFPFLPQRAKRWIDSRLETTSNSISSQSTFQSAERDKTIAFSLSWQRNEQKDLSAALFFQTLIIRHGETSLSLSIWVFDRSTLKWENILRSDEEDKHHQMFLHWLEKLRVSQLEMRKKKMCHYSRSSCNSH